MDRRLLIQRVLLGTTTLILVPSIITGCEKTAIMNNDSGNGPVPDNPNLADLVIDISTPAYSVLNSPGGFKVVEGIIIANTGNNGFVALESICTHQGGQVNYKYNTNSFECPLHGSVFSVTGSVLNGPANIPLNSYTISRSGDILTIIR
jgi:cytochrome b6-f complex iron-sulfur subunit